MNKNEKENLLPRPSIVVVMGHVDHGKTTLLDYIRKTNVASREAGGITQSIGAYEIGHQTSDVKYKKITFIDTPGHEAFSKMRSRGANVADLAILVVAAEEGVKPQTKESIRILEETKTPFIVAITKIDKPGADVDRVKNDLANNGVLLEGLGGQVSFHAVSAKTGEGVSELLDLIVLAAELENLTYDPDAPSSGFILETKIDKRRGLEAAVIVKNGVLKQGDAIATPTASGRVKILENFLEETVKELAPSAPALIIGFEKMPQVGEEFVSGTAALTRNGAKQDVNIAKAGEVQAKTGKEERETLNVIIKADDSGSLEALTEILKAMTTEKPLKIVARTVGEVGDNDVKLAISSKSLVVGFKTKVDKTAKNLAEMNDIKIITSDIIYELLKSIEGFISEAGKPATVGELEVLAVFNQKKLDKQLVGGRVLSGVMRNKATFEVVRPSESSPPSPSATAGTVGNGRILNLQQQKKEVSQVTEGNECGLLVSAQAMINIGDHIVIRSNN